ncbi:MAG: THO complex subunit 2 [Icmadophila ericetorum]|nr:THO complex subunit 2 [Icmadophila ericetorum]
MAPGGTGKRKRGDRTYSQDSTNNGPRPSPHRPADLSLAQHGQQHQGQQQYNNNRDFQDQRGSRGGRGRGRGGRGGGPTPRNPPESPNANSTTPRPQTANTSVLPHPPSPSQRPSEPKAPVPITIATSTTASTQTSIPEPPSGYAYLYGYLTDEKILAWQSSGRKDVLEFSIKARDKKDAMELGLIFQEVIRSAMDRRLDPADAGNLVKEIIGDANVSDGLGKMESQQDTTSHFDAKSLFLDCLSTLTDNDSVQPSARTLLFATGIPPLVMRQQLENTLLQNVGLIRDTFTRMGIRKTTNLLYRQANYNLLREETEGYSKLITELFTTSSNEPPSTDVVEDTFERVKGMIGTFDLDVGRVLDVTLDVFAAVLVKQYRFFVKYLRISSWWPQPDGPASKASTGSDYTGLPKWALPGTGGYATLNDEERSTILIARDERDAAFWEKFREEGLSVFFELGGCLPAKLVPTPTSLSNSEDKSQLDEDRKWIELTGTLPPPGNKVAAQILGFKLRFYSSSARDPTDILPVNLIFLAALLIKIGFISLRDLYPHLWPDDEAMEGVREQKMKEKAEKERSRRPGGGAMNALMLAGALVDDTIPAPRRVQELKPPETNTAHGGPPKPDTTAEKAATPPKVEEKEQLPDPLDQKVSLLKSLLSIGALPESLYMLGRLPWLIDAFPELPEYIHRILHHSLHKVYEPLQPLNHCSDLREPQKIVEIDQAGLTKGQIRRTDPPPRKTLRWALLDKDDTNEGTDYKFYWDDWADNIPVCQSVDDVFSLCGSLLNLTGVKVGQDPALLLKLARIGSHSLATNPSESNRARWVELSKRIIVPALSMTKCNPGVVNEVFELLKHFNTKTRFNIYSEWYEGTISRLSDMTAAFAVSEAETKDVLKRISKTNVKPMARALAKVAYASPGVVFRVAMAQIESYDNLVEVVVECARYFTYLGYDVLTWSLMSSLGAKDRQRVQADGMLTSRWLAALSLFAGKVFKRYSIMTPTPILQFVAEQLRKGVSTELVVLEQITGSMGGIVSDTNFNDAQVFGMAGGEVLQAQTMLQLLDRRHESKTTARRLMKALVEPRLAGQLLILIAQERQTSIYKIPDDEAHLKLLGNLFDEIHRVLTQYLDLLRSNLPAKEFDALVPDVVSLISDFGIDPSVAFWINRSSIVAMMVEHDSKMSEKEPEAKELTTKETTDHAENQDIDMANTDAASEDVIPQAVETEAEFEIVGEDVVMGDEGQEQSSVAKANGAVRPWHPVLQNIMEAIRPTIPSETWENLGEAFYVTFWQLSLADLMVPTQSYDDEQNKLRKKFMTINSDRSDVSVAGTAKKEREKKSIVELQEKLNREFKDHIHAHTQTRARLNKEKEFWFENAWGKWDALNTSLIEQCFFPRIMLSPTDAIYTFKMLKHLHASGATNFRTMGVLDQLFLEKRLTHMIFLSTTKEAENLGRFYNELLKDLSIWHANKANFEKDAYGVKRNLPGFCRKMHTDNAIATFFTYEDFRRILLKWHRNLNQALKTCLGSGEYMHIRNAITVQRAIYLYFPAINWMGQSQIASITELSRTESREDLKIAAMSLLGTLKKREKDWMLPQAFNLNEPSANGPNGVRSSSIKPRTPQPESESQKNLNAKAPEFMPSGQTNTNGPSKVTTTASGRLEVEDGEIDDANMANTLLKAPPTVTSDQVETTTSEAQASDIPPAKVEEAHKPASEDAALPSTSTSLESLQASQPATASSAQLQPKAPPKSNINASAVQHSIPSRLAANRGGPDQSTNDRPPHNLPTRPEPNHYRGNEYTSSERRGERPLPRDVRDSRYSDIGRAERPGDVLRDRLSERHSSTPYQRHHDRSLDRPVERPPLDDRDVPGRGPLDDRYPTHARDPRASLRDERDRFPRDKLHSDLMDSGRGPESQGRSRDSSMAPPRPGISQPPERVALAHPQDIDRGHSMTHPDRRIDSSGRLDSHPGSARGSRTVSPARRDDTRPPRLDGHRERDDRPSTDSRRPPDDTLRPHSRYDETRPPPTGPRGELGPQNPSDRFRETLRNQPSTAPSTDLNHGRLNQDAGLPARQSEQYGRLNAGSDIPSGPRLPNGNAPPTRSSGRSANNPQHINTQLQPASQTSLSSPKDRVAPTGPSSGRGPPRNLAQFNRGPQTPSSAPPTPVAESPDMAGIHPDRIKAFQDSEAATQSRIQPASSSSAHTPSLTAPAPASSSPPATPRGPNNAQTQNNFGSARQGPPTGPSFGSDRGRGDKRFANLQNIIQQSGGPAPQGQGTSIRGRGGRANNPINNHSSSPVTLGPPAPANAPPIGRQDPLFARPDLREKPDLFSGRSSGPGTPKSNEDDRRDNRDGRRDRVRDEGEKRSSRREGRSPGREYIVPSGVIPPQHQPGVREEDRSVRRGDDYRRDQGRGGMPISGGREPPPRRVSGDELLDRDRRAEPVRREVDAWNGDRRNVGPPGPERRDDRDRDRRDMGSIGRKRGRGGEDLMGPGPGDRGYPNENKRPRRNG